MRRLVLGLVCAACTGAADGVGPGVSGGDGSAAVGYQMYVTGRSTNAVTTSASRAVYLAGGGVDVDAGMRWLLARGGQLPDGGFGDVVVLRTSGQDGYNDYLVKLGANRVTTFVISTREGANSSRVIEAIRNAEVLFVAGGDQWTYIERWAGTALQQAVNERLRTGVPIGGTSAGLNVLSEHVFAAPTASTTSAMALANPYDRSIAFERALFDVPLLTGVLAEPHLVPRDRLGRFYTFLARLQADGTDATPRGLAVDEGTGVGIAMDGTATVFGAGTGVYLITTIPAPSSRLSAPLTYTPMTVRRVPVGGSFSVGAFASAGPGYTVWAAGGTMYSSSGQLYEPGGAPVTLRIAPPAVATSRLAAGR